MSNTEISHSPLTIKKHARGFAVIGFYEIPIDMRDVQP